MSANEGMGVGGGALCPGSNEAEVWALNKGVEAVMASTSVAGKVVVIQSDCRSALHMLDESALIEAGALAVRKKHVKGHQGAKNARAAVNTWADREAYKEMASHRLMYDEAVAAEAIANEESLGAYHD